MLFHKAEQTWLTYGCACCRTACVQKGNFPLECVLQGSTLNSIELVKVIPVERYLLL